MVMETERGKGRTHMRCDFEDSGNRPISSVRLLYRWFPDRASITKYFGLIRCHLIAFVQSNGH
jgi:hypothetical protein